MREIYKNMPCVLLLKPCALVFLGEACSPRSGCPSSPREFHFSLVAEELFLSGDGPARVADATGPGVEMVK